MASLIQDNRSGLYYAQFYSTERRPKRKTIPLKTTRRKVAKRALVRLEDAYALGEYDPWAPSPEAPSETPEDLSLLGDARRAYLASCSHLKAKTVKTYDDILRPFMEYVGEDFPVLNLAGTHVEAWLDSTAANDVTRRKYTHHLGYLFRFLVRRGYMDADVSKDVRLRRVPEQAPKAMSPDEVDRLVQAICDYNVANNRGGADYIWLARLVRFNVHVGLRRGELIHLRWEHIDLKRRVLRVVNSKEFTTKTVRERTIPLCEQACEVLQEQCQDRAEGYVFQLRGRKLNHNTLTHYFRRFRRLAGLPEQINVHSTRHTFATWLAERGVPVTIIQNLMGHSSVKTTERYMSMRTDVTEQWVTRAFDSNG